MMLTILMISISLLGLSTQAYITYNQSQSFHNEEVLTIYETTRLHLDRNDVGNNDYYDDNFIDGTHDEDNSNDVLSPTSK